MPSHVKKTKNSARRAISRFTTRAAISSAFGAYGTRVGDVAISLVQDLLQAFGTRVMLLALKHCHAAGRVTVSEADVEGAFKAESNVFLCELPVQNNGPYQKLESYDELRQAIQHLGAVPQ